MLIKLTIAFIAGLLIGWRLEVPPMAIGLFLAGAGLLAAWLRASSRTVLPGLLLVALILGTLRYEISHNGEADHLSTYHSVNGVMLEGVVAGDPQATGTYTRVRLRVERIFANGQWQDAAGHVLVNLRAPLSIVSQRDQPYFRYGDQLMLQGELRPPPVLENFDYAAYLARQGIGSVMSFPKASLQSEGGGSRFYGWLYGVRHRLAFSLARSMPEPQAALGQSMLLGIRDGLPADLEEDFRTTGTSHLLAISGLHIGVLLAMSLGLSQAILGRRRHLYLIAPLALIWLYALLSGASPSAVRAAIMGTVYLAALLSGRPRNVLPALALAAAVMVAIDPEVIWSISFQLSFAAMAGIAILADPIGRTLRGEDGAWRGLPIKAAILGTIGVTLAATITTVPLVAFYFQQVSLVGIPASLLTLPAMPFVLITNALAGLGGLISPAVGTPLGWLAWLFSSYVIGVVRLLALVPTASVNTGEVAIPFVVAWYTALTLAYSLRKASNMDALRERLSRLATKISPMPGTRRNIFRRHRTWVALPLFALAAALWVAALSGPEPRLHVYFVDVGQGDATFIVTPGGNQVLVDGGPDPQRIAQFLGERMSPEDRTIDLFVLTHPHADHATGLVEVLRRYKVGLVMHRTLDYESPTYREWLRAVEQEEAVEVEALAGQVINFDDGVTLQVLNPPTRLPEGTRSDVDNASIALLLTYGERTILLAGDMFQESERRLLAASVPLDSDVIKVGHHGSRHATTADFLAEVSPAMAVISAGADNRYGHPHQETLDRLSQYLPPDRTYVTAEDGTLELVSDGKTLELISER
ncbi:MAG: ComEC/Rec2 family competence protein [Chloroflexi bacterium]|nr:ComEC/Rec2 family competence protein [Chloroflexota bacterium]MDA1226704.1 ComEC/Rec2 family competence protein [Chloroflexota bacterium]